MKPKIVNSLILLAGLAGFGFIVIAILHSNSFNAPQKPATTVAELKSKIAANVPKPTVASRVASSTAPKQAQSSEELAHTGATGTVSLFVIAAIGAAMGHQIWIRSRIKRPLSY